MMKSQRVTIQMKAIEQLRSCNAVYYAVVKTVILNFLSLWLKSLSDHPKCQELLSSSGAVQL